MVSSKKNSKSIIALIVMALLLVASIALAATGAWFTDKLTDGGDTVNFGKIDIEYSTPFSLAGDPTLVMPGDALTVAGEIVNNEEAAYIAVKISVTGTKEAKNFYAVKKVAADGTITLASVVGGEGENLGKIVLNGDDYDNTYQGKEISITVSVAAVQQANVTLTEANTVEAYNAAVAYVTTNGNVQGPQPVQGN